MKNFKEFREEELKDGLDDSRLDELFENGEIVEEFKVIDNKKENSEYSKDLIIY